METRVRAIADILSEIIDKLETALETDDYYPGARKVDKLSDISKEVEALLATKKPILIMAANMSAEELVMSMLCVKAKIEFNDMYRVKLKDEDWPRLSQAVADLSEKKISVLDRNDGFLVTVDTYIPRLYPQFENDRMKK